MPKEIRFFEIDDISIRASDGGEAEDRFVEGIGIVYDREVEIFPGFFERIRPGSFEQSVRSGTEIKCFFNHDPSMVLATTRSRPPLILDDGKDALRFKAPIPPTSYGSDLRINLERKNVRGASFAFSVHKNGDIVTIDEKGNLHREIIRGTIYEVGPVTNPAYPQTKSGLRDIESVVEEAKTRIDEERSKQQKEIDDNKKYENETSTRLRRIAAL